MVGEDVLEFHAGIYRQPVALDPAFGDGRSARPDRIGEVVLGALGSLQTRMHLCGQGLREAEALEERAAPGTVCVSHRFLSALSGQDSPGALLSEAGGDGAEAPLGWDMLQVIDETAGEGSGSDAASGRARAHRGAPRAYLLQKGQA